jgi:hypothetical protein
MSARTEQRAMSSASDAVACMLCGSQQSVAHFGGSGEGLPMSPVSERYRTPQRAPPGARLTFGGCGMVTLPLRTHRRLTARGRRPIYLEQARSASPMRIACSVSSRQATSARCRLRGWLFLVAARARFTVQGVEMSAWASRYAR